MHDLKLLRLLELAEETGLPAAWLSREADSGRLPFIRVGRSRMFDLDEVVVALKERARERTQPPKEVDP